MTEIDYRECVKTALIGSVYVQAYMDLLKIMSPHDLEKDFICKENEDKKIKELK